MRLLPFRNETMSLLDELLCDKGVVQLGLPSLYKTTFFSPGVNVLLMLRKEHGAEVLVILRNVPVPNGNFGLRKF